MNELVTNATKHAKQRAGGVRVRCLAEDGRVVFRITDNGPGFPPDFNPHEPNRFGLRMVGMMVRQARCEVIFGNPGQGSVVELRIPTEHDRAEEKSIRGG